MGSSQSTPAVSTQTPSLAPQASNAEEIVTDVVADRGKPKSKQSKNLSGFARVQHKCRRKKRAYDACYSQLYGGFLLAKETDSTGCDEVFEDWRACILRGMKKDREKRGLPRPKKESILAELDEDDE